MGALICWAASKWLILQAAENLADIQGLGLCDMAAAAAAGIAQAEEAATAAASNSKMRDVVAGETSIKQCAGPGLSFKYKWKAAQGLAPVHYSSCV